MATIKQIFEELTGLQIDPITQSDAVYFSLDLQKTVTQVLSEFQSAINLKANLSSPALTGIPTAPTAPAGTNTTQIATTAFVLTAISGKEDKLNKGIAGGYASLDSNGKVPLSQISDAVLGQLLYAGTFIPSTALAALTSNAKLILGTSASTITLTNNTAAITGYKANEGNYYIATASGTFAGITFAVGDWLLSTGSGWSKVQNTDAVTSVAGRTGAVVLSKSDVGLGSVDNTADVNKNVLSATKLTTSRTIWGRSFDGTANVSGWIEGTSFAIADNANNPYLRLVCAGITWYVQALSAGEFAVGAGASNSIKISQSGDLYVKSALTIGSTAGAAHLIFSRATYNYITAPSGGAIAFVPNGLEVNTANSALTIGAGSVRPGTTNAINLGASDSRWANVYSVLGNFSGAVTAPTFVGNLQGAADKLGTSTVGGTNRPIYLNAGQPTPIELTENNQSEYPFVVTPALGSGNENRLLYLSRTIGSTTLPIYIQGGLPKALTQANLRIGVFGSSAIGATGVPVYIAANGVPTPISLGNNITDNLPFVSLGTTGILYKMQRTYGSATAPIYINNGVATALTQANLRVGVFGTNGIGGSTSPIYIDTDGTPRAISQDNLRIGIFGSTAIGSASQPIYIDTQGIPKVASDLPLGFRVIFKASSLNGDPVNHTYNSPISLVPGSADKLGDVIMFSFRVMNGTTPWESFTVSANMSSNTDVLYKYYIGNTTNGFNIVAQLLGNNVILIQTIAIGETLTYSINLLSMYKCP